MKKKFIIFIFTALVFLFFFQIALAADEALKLQLEQPLGPLSLMTISGTSIGEYIKAIFGFGSAAVAALAIIMITTGGIKWIISAGEPGKIGDAKNQILKALLGLFIAMFAIFVLQTVSPGTVTFKGLTLEQIVGLQCCQIGQSFSIKSQDACTSQQGAVVSMGLCQQGVSTAVCQEDLSKKCGESYKDPYNNDCIGKDCNSTGANMACFQSGSSWSCAQCKAVNEPCSDNRECCEGACDTTKKICISGSNIAGALGSHCGSAGDQPCPSPLVCQTNWYNTCNYGRAGMPCSSNNECNRTEGFYCADPWKDFTRNTCVKNIGWGRCNPDDPLCPSGFTCAKGDVSSSDFKYCPVGIKGCKISTTLILPTESICVPNDWKDNSVLCVCDCNSNSDCPQINGKPGICNEDGNDYCTPGTYGSPCEENIQCLSGFCNTDRLNLCTQGDSGEACANASECRPGMQCCKSVCMPNTFTCP